MSMIDTDLFDISSSSLSSKFHYGHHPSIIMWSTGKSAKKEEKGTFLDDALGGVARSLESITTGSVPENFNSFKFDAMVSEEHDAQAQVTAFPVSSGFMVSDHLIKRNRVLRLIAVAVNMQNSAVWSASLQGLSVATGAIFSSPVIPLLGGLAGGVASAFETSDRIQSTYNLFYSLMSNGTKLYISTIVGPYLNCVITNIKTKTDKMTSAMLAVEITVEELQVIGEDVLATEARKAMESMYDYSEFAKMAQGMAIGVIGGAPLPGLGVLGDPPTKQLATLKGKLAKLAAPLSSVKGRLL